MKIVLDTNVLVSGVFWKGVPGILLDAVVSRKLDLVTTPSILMEYHHVLEAMAGPHDAALVIRWSRFIAESATLVNPVAVDVECRDPHDQKFLECAVSGEADLIVSGDKDLLTLGDIDGISIVSPRTAVRRL